MVDRHMGGRREYEEEERRGRVRIGERGEGCMRRRGGRVVFIV